jgi:hypothetical protein
MLHTSGLPQFANTASCSKILEMRDGAEGLTEEWINGEMLG